MIGYASRPGGRAHVAALATAGWGWFVTPGSWTSRTAIPDGQRFALDNGAWTAHTTGTPFSHEAFEAAVEALGPRADFIVLPDVVAGGLHSLEVSLAYWLSRDRWPAPVLLAVQDGMEPSHLAGALGADLGLFVGGSTEWKEATLPMWGEVAQDTGAYLHVGRVNSRRRIRACLDAGADSIDGSGPTQYGWASLSRLEHERSQPALFSPATDDVRSVDVDAPWTPWR